MDVHRHGRRQPGGRPWSRLPPPRPRSEPWARGSSGDEGRKREVVLTAAARLVVRRVVA